MAICFFTRREPDGAGDVAQTVKTADIVQKKAGATDVIIVVPDENTHGNYNHKNVAENFTKEINPHIKVQTISEFKKSNPHIDYCVQAGYLTSFDWKTEIEGMMSATTPVVVIPEYNSTYNVSENKKNQINILTGFDNGLNQVGVLVDPDILRASADDAPDNTHEIFFNQLDDKIKKQLGGDYISYQNRQASRNFSYQYSHDKDRYQSYFGDGEKYNTRTPVDFFLQDHIMFNGDSSNSQDVLCIGESSDTKKQALKAQLEHLKNHGYNKITFVNIDDDVEEALFQDSEASLEKEYRVLYSSRVSHASMKALPILSDNIVGATGDNSLVEAMAAKKLVSYECVPHKERFARAYLAAVDKATTNDDVKQLAKFLMKPTARQQRKVEYDEDTMKALLKKPEVVGELKEINRNLIANSQYANKVEEVVSNLHANNFQLEQPQPVVEPTPPIEPQKTGSKMREMFKDSKIPTTYFDEVRRRIPSEFERYKRQHQDVVQNAIIQSPVSTQPNDLKRAFISSIEGRYENYNMNELGDYRDRVDQVLDALDKLDNPSRATIMSTINEWYLTLPAEQQNQFKGEMPMMVDDSVPDIESIDSIRPR